MVDISPYDFMELEEKNEICMRGPTNSHALNTKRKKMSDYKPELVSLIDWFSMTFSTDFYNIQFVLNLLFKYLDLPLDIDVDKLNIKDSVWQQNVYLESGYSDSISYGHITILYNSKSRGIKLSMSGQGCRDFELLLKDNYSWLDFFREVSSLDNTNITRIDLAIDDYFGYFKVRDLITIADNGYMRSKIKKYKDDSEKDSATGKSLGDTLKLGSRYSNILIRIYEKNKEQGLPDDFIWNRVELQITRENAEIALNVIKDGEKYIGEYALGMLKNYVTFCDPYRKVNKDGSEERRITPDINKSRWLPTKVWEEFLHEADKIRIGREKPKSNITTKRKWIDDKVAKTIAMSVLAEIDTDRDMLWLKDVIYRGMLKFDDKDKALIRKYREDKKRTVKERQSKENIIDYADYNFDKRI